MHGNMTKIMYFSHSDDPYFNLSAERALLDLPGEDEESLFLYVNSSSVIIGRYQNPLVECRPEFCMENNIPFIRRFSGGGTVYHGPGNINYGFIGGREGFVRSKNTDFLKNTFRSIGIEADSGERGDLFLKGKKFSGNAFRYIRTRVLHHGTILIKADLETLGNCISKEKPGWIISKGIESARASVCNLSDVYPDISRESIFDLLKAEFRPDKVKYIQDCPRIIDQSEQYNDKLKSQDWKWGASPEFSITADSGEVVFSVRKGIISHRSGADFSVLPAEFSRETLLKLHENIDLDLYRGPLEKLLNMADFLF